MNPEDCASYRNMLSNERSFDKIFCDVAHSKKFELFYNKDFFGDPVFNHTLISESILNGSEGADDESINLLLGEIREESFAHNVAATIFVEKFWKQSGIIEKNAIEFGYMIAGVMNILSKRIIGQSKDQSKSDTYSFTETKDVSLWNNIFMRAFSISSDWERELERRLKRFSLAAETSLFLAVDTRGTKPLGCLLLHRMPPGLMGVYCVGTLPGMRNRGVASFMMKQAERHAFSSGCENLTLQTILADATTPFYVKLGYKVEFDRDILRLP